MLSLSLWEGRISRGGLIKNLEFSKGCFTPRSVTASCRKKYTTLSLMNHELPD